MNMIKTLLATSLIFSTPFVSATELIPVAGGEYIPLYLKPDTPKIKVKPFQIDKYPVTNQQFADFLQKNPQWQKDRISSKHADAQYLSNWQQTATGYTPKPENLNKPVTFVSWFAANAYCKAQGKRLPTIDQWEFAGLASEVQADGSRDKAYRDKILNWYAQGISKGMNDVGKDAPNFYGIHDMHGLIWEWTEDFNSSLLSSGSADSSMFCSGAATGAADPSDYAAFMRYGFRTSMQSKYTVHNLGFRCAK